jgi:regulator of cell morphogenesis and NO signaling
MPFHSFETTVGHLVAEHPGRAVVFERLGIDYCCRGYRSLREACAARGLDPSAVLRDLEAVGHESEDADSDWTTASLAALADHIVAVHHDYLRETLPRLAGLLEKVVQAHGERDPSLSLLQRRFATFSADLDGHMRREEEILFPLIRSMEQSQRLPAFACGGLRDPIRVMVSDHEEAGADLAAMRQLTHDYTPPADACNTYRALLAGLAELEADLHRHVHKENYVLFPRALALQDQLSAGGAVG